MIVLPLAQADVRRTRGPSRVRVYPLHRNLGRRRTDVLDALRDQHNLPRPSISPKAAGEQSSVGVHSPAEAPEPICPAQHSTSQGSRAPSSQHSSRDGGADPKGAS
jgi:hypothetical protein